MSLFAFKGNFLTKNLYLYIIFVTEALQKKHINFSIDFLTPTTVNLPIIKKLTFPALKSISVCFWYYLKTIPKSWRAVFTYASYDIPGEFVVWIGVNEVSVSMRNKELSIGNVSLKINVWTHMCWTWKMDGSWNLFVNATLNAQGKSNLKEFNRIFTSSKGTLILGQDLEFGSINNPDEMFNGKLTQLFIYQSLLTKQEIIDASENNSPQKDIIVGWWQFRHLTSGINIVQEPFDIRETRDSHFAINFRNLTTDNIPVVKLKRRL